MSQDFILGDDLQIFVLVRHIFMLDHDFADRSLFGEIEFIDSLFKQLRVDVVQTDNYLGADGFDCWLLVWLQHIHCLSDM